MTTAAGSFRLELNNNQLNGEIPPEFGNPLKSVCNSVLYYNQLGGETFRQSLGNLSNLRAILALATNQLTGQIPPEVGKTGLNLEID